MFSAGNTKQQTNNNYKKTDMAPTCSPGVFGHLRETKEIFNLWQIDVVVGVSREGVGQTGGVATSTQGVDVSQKGIHGFLDFLGSYVYKTMTFPSSDLQSPLWAFLVSGRRSVWHPLFILWMKGCFLTYCNTNMVTLFTILWFLKLLALTLSLELILSTNGDEFRKMPDTTCPSEPELHRVLGLPRELVSK